MKSMNQKPDVIETNVMEILPVLSKGEVLATINQKLGDVVGAAKATRRAGVAVFGFDGAAL